MNISPYDFQLQFTFASDKLAELDRKLALLYSTREGTMPLDREFGINMDFVDMPPEVAKSLYVAEITNPSVSAAGVTQGCLITKIDDVDVTSQTAITSYLVQKTPGDTVTLEVYNGLSQQTFTVDVTLMASGSSNNNG